MAEEATQAAAPQPKERVFNFSFTESQANLILASLGEMPFKQVADIVNVIHAQANSQMTAQPVAE